MQFRNDEGVFGVTNDWKLLASGVAAAAFLLWTVLFVAYRLDRSDAAAVASATVLLVIPPLATYYVLLELTRDMRSLALRMLCVYAAAVLWFIAQRNIVSPAFGFQSSAGESAANFILLPLFGLASWFGVRSLLYRKRLSKAMELQAQTELRLLNAQLAPHTLFNMMNAVYSVLLTDPQKAIPLFLSMSEALRHVVEHTRKRWVPLHEELDFIEHYAILERARNPERVAIAVETEGDLDAPVPPMLLASLFENAVKHGRLPDGSLNIRVTAKVDDALMLFVVSNRYSATERPGAGMGIGQSNVRDRLRLLYPGRHSFSAAAEQGEYRATIKINS